ncbi:hypothetical protein C8T65DRAFT_772529 [Cerioporus squamosus]|nr:hypothetical protein C8T65DRAFT_772529 [Cerioporus squamosus]
MLGMLLAGSYPQGGPPLSNTEPSLPEQQQLADANTAAVSDPITEIERIMSKAGLVQQDMEVWNPVGTSMVLAQGVVFLARDSVLALSPYLAQCVNEERTKVLLPGWMPVLCLEEPAAEVRHFLRTLSKIHDHTSLEPIPSFNVVWACAILGQKYERTDLRDHALAHLKAYCTDDYDDFQANGRQRLPPGFKYPHAIGLLNLARLTDAHTLLPLVVMSCTMLKDTDIFVRLKSKDLTLCIAAERRMVVRAIDNAGRVYMVEVAQGCRSRGSCEDALQWLNTWHARMVGHSPRWHDLLKILWGPTVVEKAFSGLWKHFRLCQHCSSMLDSRQDGILRRTWRDLPCILTVRILGWPGECPVH